MVRILFLNTRLLLLALFVSFTALPVLAAPDVQINRGQVWLRAQYHAKLTSNGFGVIAMAGSRYNYALTKTVDADDRDADTQEKWLQEFWVGPSWSKKISPKLLLKANLLYRPQMWYIDDKASEGYMRTTFTNVYTLFQKAGPVKMQYRVMLWNQFAVENRDLDNELYNRNLVGVIVPIGKKVSLFAKDELFLKLTADDTDKDGTEVLSKNVIWSGASIKVAKSLTIALQYVFMETYKKPTFKIRDHYIFMDVKFATSFVSKK